MFWFWSLGLQGLVCSGTKRHERSIPNLCCIFRNWGRKWSWSVFSGDVILFDYRIYTLKNAPFVPVNPIRTSQVYLRSKRKSKLLSSPCWWVVLLSIVVNFNQYCCSGIESRPGEQWEGYRDLHQLVPLVVHEVHEGGNHIPRTSQVGESWQGGFHSGRELCRDYRLDCVRSFVQLAKRVFHV